MDEWLSSSAAKAEGINVERVNFFVGEPLNDEDEDDRHVYEVQGKPSGKPKFNGVYVPARGTGQRGHRGRGGTKATRPQGSTRAQGQAPVKPTSDGQIYPDDKQKTNGLAKPVPATRYQSAASAAYTPEGIANSLLKSTMVSLPLDQLLAVTPGVSAKINDYTRVRRLNNPNPGPANGPGGKANAAWEDYHDDIDPEEDFEHVMRSMQQEQTLEDDNMPKRPTASVPLRTIEVRAGDPLILLEGILDSGSLMVIMSKNAWLRTHLELDPNN